MKIFLILAITLIALLGGAAFVIPIWSSAISVQEFYQQGFLPIDQAMAKGDPAAFVEFKKIATGNFIAVLDGKTQLDLKTYLAEAEGRSKDPDRPQHVTHELMSAQSDGATAVLTLRAEVTDVLIDHKGLFGKPDAEIPLTESFIEHYQLRKSGDTWRISGIERTSSKELAAKDSQGGKR